MTKDKERHHIMIKGSVHQKDVTIIYPPNIRATKYIKQTLAELKGEVIGNVIIIGTFNISLSIMDRMNEYPEARCQV